MAGIYIHIPFCRKKCSYCDFYFLARIDLAKDFHNALLKEIKNKSNIKTKIETIYFGGGTPSLIPSEYILEIIELIKSNYTLNPNAEITLEANPEDVKSTKLISWKNAGVNRLSIGVQSLDDNILQKLRRNHSAKDALNAIELSQKYGFSNISGDLIYGLPGLDSENWTKSLITLLNSGITHLSSYHLILEMGTLMNKQIEKGILNLPTEDESINQFRILFELSEKMGFPWYEISNFAKPEMESKHNSSYWNGTTYIGFGPAAHSYNGQTRYWNRSDIKAYISNPIGIQETEILTPANNINDYFITHLRTRKGLNIQYVKDEYPWYDINIIEEKFKELRTNGMANSDINKFNLNPSGLFLSDAVLKDIMYI